MSAVEPLTTTVVANWDEVEAYLAEHASSDTYTLTQLTAYHDADLHHIAIDPSTRTVWWAWDNSVADEDGWTIDQLTPEGAAEMASDQIAIIQDRMDNPEAYAEGREDLDSDQEVMDEYTQILRLGLPEDPEQARRAIAAKRRSIRQDDELWQRTYSELVRDLAGSERGGKSQAARALRISDMQVGRIIRQDDERREALAAEVREIQAGYDPAGS